MMSVIRFVIFLALIIIAVVGGYYYLSVRQNHQVVEQQTQPFLDARIKGAIPQGAVTEDGAVGE